MHKRWMLPVLALALACTVSACGMDDNGTAGSPGTGADQNAVGGTSSQERMLRQRLNTEDTLEQGRYRADKWGEVDGRTGDTSRDLTRDARDLVRDAETGIRSAARDIWD